MKERLKKKWVIAGISVLAYKALTEYFGVPVAIEDYRLAVDILAYAIAGVAVWSDHSE